jgi:hypothetical protein
VVACCLGLALWLRPGQRVERNERPLAADITVKQWIVQPTTSRPLGVVGTDVHEVPFGGWVTVDVRQSAVASSYLLALNPDGKVQLLWPVNEAGKPDESVAPPRQQAFRYPARQGEKGKAVLFRLNDEPAGGLQAFAVVASRSELPAYQEWTRKHGKVLWRRLPAEGVWCTDRTGVHAVLAGEIRLRGSEEEVAGLPPLQEVVASLGPAEAVTVWAFPVGKKEE